MKTFRQFINESIIDPERDSYSSDVFDLSGRYPKLNQNTLTTIKIGLDEISNHVKVLDITLIGSIVTKRYLPDADIDLNVLVDAGEMKNEDLWKLAGEQSGRLIPGTEHPVNFHFLTSKKEFDRANNLADGEFDVKANKFIRLAKHREFNISKYFNEFRSVLQKLDLMKEDLKHELFDYEALKGQDVGPLKKLIQDELSKIESSVNGLVDFHKKIQQDRRDAFARPLTTKEIREYGQKNALPENVVYKLLERQHYIDFLNKIEDIVGDDDKVSPDEADELKKVVNESRLNESSITLYHTSHSLIQSINRYGKFGSFLFFSSNPSHYGDIVYKIVIDQRKILDVRRLFYLHKPNKKIKEILKEIMEMTDCDEETAMKYLDQSESHHDPEIDWAIQKMTGDAAVSLGYVGIALPDEHGTSYMIDMYGKEKQLIKEDFNWIPGTSEPLKDRIKEVFAALKGVSEIPDLLIFSPAQRLMDQAKIQLKLSDEMVTKILRLSRGIANLDRSKEILAQHVAEAISYRMYL